MSENIYNLVPREYTLPEKEPMYKSKYDPGQQLAGSTFGCFGTTRLYGAGEITKKEGSLYGPPTLSSGLTSSPTKSPSKKMNQSGNFTYTDRMKAAVPTKSDKPIMGITTTKNFVTANAVEAILQVPKQPNSMELNYMKKEDFGKVPAYLTQVKDEIRRENEMIDRYVKEQIGEVAAPSVALEELSEEERNSLVLALKAKWDAVNAQYQKITHLVRLDTTGQVRRKETLEATLQQLETDIEKLQRASNVFIKK